MACKKSSSCMSTTVCHYPSKTDLDRKKTQQHNRNECHITTYLFHLLAPLVLLVKKYIFISDNVNKYYEIFLFQ